ncbi:MAG TPA: sodium:alanine symporter family protein [Balneolaceae bacterium]|nr:sodium:alanine symporter family protein [Balneolaceae bacterium]
MDLFQHIVETVNNLVWNRPSFMPLMVAALLSYGIFITLKLGFVQLRRFAHGVKVVSGFYDNPEDTGDVNHFQALSTALSATVGIGNIAGVAIAIHYGGPGALFWMWITAFLGMATKYSECTLSVMYRDKNPDGSVSGGPMYYISKGLGNNWMWLAVAFACLAVICSFLTGNAVQANTMADTMESAFFIPKWITGLFSAGVVGLVILGGIKRIGRVTARLTPLMALIYVLGALSILLVNYQHVIPSLIFIVKSAFSPEAGAFGIITGTFMSTMVWGVKRGLFSNEAGQGSAPIAHGAAKTEEPVREGVVALLEPFIDTLLICTMTGLVIVITGVWNVKHDAKINLNSLETEITFSNPTAQTLNVENGIITDGQLKKSDVVIDSLYSNYEETKLLNGTIAKKGDQFVATTSTGEKITSVYGEVVENGAPLTAMAFESGLSPLFPGGQYIVTLCVFLFPISTSISWSYYGDRAIQFLLGDRSIIYYKVVYIVMHFIGAILTLATVWSIGDIALGLMTFPNLIALFALSGVVASASKKYFDKVKAESKQVTD